MLSGTLTAKTTCVWLGNHLFFLTEARTDQQRQKGLMHQTSLGLDAGLLFIYDRAVYVPIWMRNTVLPLDIIWLDRNYRVVDLYLSAVPFDETVLMPKQKAKYVIEVWAGTVKRTGLKINDIVIPLER